MFNLDPTKLLIIAVVAVILLGPDKLPQVARQAGAAWRTFNDFRHRMESEVRESIPDLPSSADIARMARSPSTLLNHLSTLSSDDSDQDGTAASGAVTNGAVANGAVANGASENVAAGEAHVTETSDDPSGAESYGEHATTPGPAAAPTASPTTRPMSPTPPSTTPAAFPSASPSASSSSSASGSSGPGVMGDPSLN